MATQSKDFKVKNGLQVGGPTNLVNYTSSSPSNPFIGQLWISSSSLYAWSSASTWVLVGDGTTALEGNYLTVEAAASVYFPISSSVSNFGTIKTSPATENIVADLITDELTVAAENGIILSGTASADQLTISTNATWNNTASAIVMRGGDGSFSVSAVDLDTSASPALSVGRIQWNQDFGAPEVGLIGGNVTANIGQHVHAFVTNDEASSLVKGDVVYLFGASGNRASVKKAYNLSDTTSSKTFGVVAETIAAGQTGFVTVFGVVTNLDLSSYSPGDVLWLSASPGKFTNIKPSAPQHLVFIGVVERANAGNGQLFVNVQNGYELEELHSVTITNITDNDILSYNGSSSLWFNQNLATAIQEVDGAGSGIDADLLDSHQASYFLNTSSATQEKTGTVTFHGTVNVENLVITGSATTITSSNLALTDSLIQLAHEQYTADAVDIGIVGSYGDGTTSSAGHYHASFARDASQNKWKLLSNGPAPVNNVIDYTDPSVEFGTLQIGALEVTSSAVVTNLNADLLDGYSSTYFLSADTASSTYAPLSSPALTGTPTAPTATVDNNSTQIATTAYVIGQGYLKSATASSIYIAQSSPKTGTASIVYSDHPTLIRPLLQSPQEIATISATAATASINYDVLSQTVLYYTSSAIGNWHLNIRGNSTNTLSSLLEVGESITLVFGVDQGTTAYYQLNLMIDGTQVTPRWQGGSAPTGGNISGTDIYSYTIVKTAATPTYRVFAALTGFA